MRPLIAALLALCTLAVSAAPLPQVTTRGDEFVVGDQAFRFVGVNLRGAQHYGKGDILIWTTAQNRIENLDEIAAMGGKVIRVFAPIDNPNRDGGETAVEELVERMGTLLDECEARGIYVIIALTDFYAASNFRVPGDAGYYTDNGFGYQVLNDAWFAGGYAVNYLPYVQAMVTAHSAHSAVFSWQIGNEMTDYGGTDNIIPFTHTMADAIRAIDSDTMISFGGLGIDHFGYAEPDATGLDFYDHPNLDFVTIHIYDGGLNDATFRIAEALDMPIIISETGNRTSYTGDRPGTLTSQMAAWMDARAGRGIMQWGFQVQNIDIGDGDGLFGMDNNTFGFDYNGMKAAYSGRATTFANLNLTVPVVTTPAGTNLATSAVGWLSSGDFSAAYGVDKAIDGVVNAASKWTSNGGANPWLALDLGEFCAVTGAVVRCAGDAHERAAYNFEQFTVSTGTSINGPWTQRFAHTGGLQRNVVTAHFTSTVQTQFVRIDIQDAGTDAYARLPEFEVYGSSSVPVGLLLLGAD